MTSWIHLFSKFTTEALLIEFFFICLMIAGYTSFWILRKRKLGAVKDAVPASLVRTYLNELIGEAHLVRTQLFGLLADTGMTIPGSAVGQADQLLEALKKAQGQAGATADALAAGNAVPANRVTPAAVIASDPELKAKLAQLEAKLAEQTKATETVLIEKTKMLKELELAKAAANSSKGGAPAGNSAETDELKKKVQLLEEKLAEYSVIEDDLANLKKLQQENVQLRTALGGKSAGPAAGASVAAMAAPAPAAQPAAAAEPAAIAAPEPMTAAPANAPLIDTGPATQSNAEAAIAAATSDTGFEQAVDQIETSIAAPAAAAPTAAVTPAAQPTAASAPAPLIDPASTVQAAPANVVKSEEDLLSEFEKMLDS